MENCTLRVSQQSMVSYQESAKDLWIWICPDHFGSTSIAFFLALNALAMYKECLVLFSHSERGTMEQTVDRHFTVSDISDTPKNNDLVLLDDKTKCWLKPSQSAFDPGSLAARPWTRLICCGRVPLQHKEEKLKK